MIYLKKAFKKGFLKLIYSVIPALNILEDEENNWFLLKSKKTNFSLGKNTQIYKPYRVDNLEAGNYTYVSGNSVISNTKIGKFCSIGPNFICGWGIHPTNGLSTAPMFYSVNKQNGTTLTKTTKIEERKPIVIGNDVFIGANVTVLDGITIGDGAVIGAGAVVSKNIPPYAIAVGSPIQVIKYRFEKHQIDELLKIKWWDFNEVDLIDVERHFFNIDEFISKFKND